MKKKNRLHDAAAFAVMIILLFSFAACNEYESKEDLELLKRIPDGDFMVFSAKPIKILNSQFVNTAIEMDVGMDEFLRNIARFEREFGVNPRTDIDRFTAFSDDFKGIKENYGLLVQGDFKNFDFENMVWEMDAEESTVTIASYEVHMLTHRMRSRDRVQYFYYDDNEIIVGADVDFMEKILNLKKGTGADLSANTDFIRKLNSIKNKDDYWFVVPTNQLIEDVLDKVRARDPRFSGEILQIEAFLGGFSIGDELKSNFQAYNSNEEQLDLLYNLAYSARGLGALALIEYPEIKDILSRIDINKSSDHLDISCTLTQDDLEMLDELHGRLPFRRR
ncbi:MAG: hypothetical protein GY863_14355 [bacterium]|nr:hypothetical protein [bacterium]